MNTIPTGIASNEVTYAIVRRPQVLITLAGLGFLAQMPSPRAVEPAMVVVELFTSEGCESCPPADVLLKQLADHPPVGVQVAALGEHVDYWDSLGWKDRFSSAALTDRQNSYAHAFKSDGIYTPQAIVDGRVALIGSDGPSVRHAISQAASRPHGFLRLILEPVRGDRVKVDVAVHGLPVPGPGDRDAVVVAVTEDGLKSNVLRGENRGRLLTHAPVVHRLTEIGDTTSQPVRAEIAIDPAWRRDQLKIVAFVQESRSRRIVAAASATLVRARL